MKLIRALLVCTALLVSGNLALNAQQPRVSPPDIISVVVDGCRVTLAYSRPLTKDPRTGEARKIWGGLVPFGQVWRTGANEATMLVTQQPLDIGGATIPAGAYTLFTLPQPDGSAKLIINKQLGQWGLQYDETHDLARVDLMRENVSPVVDQFTMKVERGSSGGGVIKMAWENVQYSVPFSVKKS